MTKISELVAAGEIDSSKPVIEQPGGPRQNLIKDLIHKEEEVSSNYRLGNFLQLCKGVFVCLCCCKCKCSFDKREL